MKILTAHQPTYLPWLGLFHKILLADEYVSFSEVQYVPKDWLNRNFIWSKNGEILLTVPVLTKGHRQGVISDIAINNTILWQNKHWHSICNSYAKTQYFKFYKDFFEDLYLSKKWNYLVELNEYILKSILQFLDIKVNFLRAYQVPMTGSKSDLVLSMCKSLSADIYIFGANGNNYANVESFYASNIKVYFQNYLHPVYSQPSDEFIPRLSIIDLLFNHGPKSRDILLSGNISKEGVVVDAEEAYLSYTRQGGVEKIS